jgi:hypothetical protein
MQHWVGHDHFPSNVSNFRLRQPFIFLLGIFRLLVDKYWPGELWRPKRTVSNGHYDKKGLARKANTFKKDWSKKYRSEELHFRSNGLFGHQNFRPNKVQSDTPLDRELFTNLSHKNLCHFHFSTYTHIAELRDNMLVMYAGRRKKNKKKIIFV